MTNDTSLTAAQAGDGQFSFLDHLAITNLIFAYADRMDAQNKREVPGWPSRSDAEEAETIFIYPDTGTPKTHHVTTNIMITPEGLDRASGQSYYTVFQATDDMPLQCIICGVYYDKYAKVDGVWGFVERRYEHRLFGDLTRHGRNMPPAGQPVPGRVAYGVAPFNL